VEVFIGTILGFGFNFAPRGWALCQGQTLSIAQNQALFALLGTTYGGNGVSTFQLPDLRGRLAVGQGQAPGLQSYNLGQVGGVEHVSLTQQQMPLHTHTANATSNSTSTSTSTLNAATAQGSVALPGGHALSGANGTLIYKPVTAGQTVPMAPESVGTTTTTTTNTTVTVAPAGAGLPVSIQQPYLCINYSIALLGIFPSRN